MLQASTLSEPARAIGAVHAAAESAAVATALPVYNERPFADTRAPQELQWLRRALDCVDYAMVCLTADRMVFASNRAARDELADPTHPLQLIGGSLRPRQQADVPRMQRAMHEAQAQGLRRLLMLGSGAEQLSVAVIPLSDEEPGSRTAPALANSRSGVLLVMGKRKLCESLSTDWYARERGLTWAETRVLHGLTMGLRPIEIAQRQGVALSTVRSQLRSLRAKTGSSSIGTLLRQISSLPPMLNALRGGASS